MNCFEKTPEKHNENCYRKQLFATKNIIVLLIAVQYRHDLIHRHQKLLRSLLPGQQIFKNYGS